MGRLPKTKAGMVDYKKMHRECEELFKNFSAQISPKAKVMDLSIAEQQIVEIVRSLSLDCKLIILDEPTSSLTEVETRDLFKVVNHLREQGISVLYISHRLSEVIEICDRVSVYRDGEYVDTQNAVSYTHLDVYKRQRAYIVNAGQKRALPPPIRIYERIRSKCHGS